jgi:tRNA(adenine34) deaminase
LDLPVPRDYERWMAVALDEARACAATGDVPVGAVVVDASGRVIGRGRNLREARQDPTAHASTSAWAVAEATGDRHLVGTTLVVTLEPCVMCAGAILAARVPRVVFGAWDEKAGAAGSLYDVLRDRRLPHRAEVFAGVAAGECTRLLDAFFAERRATS